MGEVNKATDINLKRAVAIKVLPVSLAGDAERLARFQREAEVLASLNHPNIAAIYGLEKADGTTALVMELVEGPAGSDRRPELGGGTEAARAGELNLLFLASPECARPWPIERSIRPERRACASKDVSPLSLERRRSRLRLCVCRRRRPSYPGPQFGYPAGASRLHAIGGAPEYRFASAIAAASGDRGAGTAR